MSKKNKLSTRRNAHAFMVEREKAMEAKREAKREKRSQKAARDKLKGVVVKKKNKRGVRLKKNSVVKGIKIKDSKSKRKARELLKAEAALKMDLG